MLKLISKEKEHGIFKRISNYRNDFKNWPVVVLKSTLNMFPFDVVLKNGARERDGQHTCQKQTHLLEIEVL